MKDGLRKQEREKLDNRVVFLSSIIIIYAILLLFIEKMASSSMTVTGAIAFIQILRWASLCGAMACAAWSAYKENFGFFIYCGICIYVFLSTTTLLYCGNHGKAYLINYGALFITFVLNQVYSFLKRRGSFEKKSVKGLYIAICILAFIFVAALCVLQILY